MPSVLANNVTIEYDERGSGEPLLLVMGLGGQLTAWREPFMDLLVERGFRVIRFDNRDVGLSTHFSDETPPGRFAAAYGHITGRQPPAPYLLSDMANDAVALLDALGIDSAHIVGASMGGMISQVLAIDHPERVRSLTSIMSTTGSRKVGRASLRAIMKLVRLAKGGDREQAIENSMQLFSVIAGPLFDPEDHRRYVEQSTLRNHDVAGTSRQAAAIAASPDRTEQLAQVKVPTLVIHGEADTLVSPSGGRATAEAIPGARLLMFEQMGHDMPAALWPDLVDAIAENATRAALA